MGSTRAARRRKSSLLIPAIVVLVLVLAGAGFAAWRFWAGPLVAREAVNVEVAAVRDAWALTPMPSPEPDADPSAPPEVAEPVLHQASWLLRLPSLGEEWPVIAGVEPDDLRRGVGWYPGSALPGQVGNLALAAHCIDGPAPFRELLQLAEGDVAVIETHEAIFTYEFISSPGELTVDEGDTWVIDPVPGETDALPTRAFLTLTTCEDLVPSPDRAVGFGTLSKTEKK